MRSTLAGAQRRLVSINDQWFNIQCWASMCEGQTSVSLRYCHVTSKINTSNFRPYYSFVCCCMFKKVDNVKALWFYSFMCCKYVVVDLVDNLVPTKSPGCCQTAFTQRSYSKRAISKHPLHSNINVIDTRILLTQILISTWPIIYLSFLILYPNSASHSDSKTNPQWVSLPNFKSSL